MMGLGVFFVFYSASESEVFSLKIFTLKRIFCACLLFQADKQTLFQADKQTPLTPLVDGW